MSKDSKDSKDKFVKYGGMKFEKNAPSQEINKFVRELPDDQKQSMHQVVENLSKADLIDLKNEVTTIDDEMIDAQRTDIGEE